MMNPRPQLWIVWISRRDKAISKLGFELRQLCHAFEPCRLVCVPAKAKAIERSRSLRAHMGRLSLLHQGVMTSLLLDPKSKLWVPWVSQGDIAMTMLSLEVAQVVDVSIPSRFLRIPREIEIVQQGDARGCYAAWFVGLEKPILFPAQESERQC